MNKLLTGILVGCLVVTGTGVARAEEKSGTPDEAVAMVKKAAALANRDTGHLEARIADALARAANDVIAGRLNAQFIVDPIQGGAGTSINMNTNEVIANRALELLGEAKGSYAVISPNSHVNMAQSTNDAFPTGIHLAALDLGKKLVAELQRLQSTYVGRIEVVKTSPDRAVCKIDPSFQKSNMMVDDRVATKIK